MAISFSGDNGITFADGTTKDTRVPLAGEIGSYVLASKPATAPNFEFGSVWDGGQLYPTNRVISARRPTALPAGTVWQCCGWSAFGDRGTLFRRIG